MKNDFFIFQMSFIVEVKKLDPVIPIHLSTWYGHKVLKNVKRWEDIILPKSQSDGSLSVRPRNKDVVDEKLVINIFAFSNIDNTDVSGFRIFYRGKNGQYKLSDRITLVYSYPREFAVRISGKWIRFWWKYVSDEYDYDTFKQCVNELKLDKCIIYKANNHALLEDLAKKMTANQRLL